MVHLPAGPITLYGFFFHAIHFKFPYYPLYLLMHTTVLLIDRSVLIHAQQLSLLLCMWVRFQIPEFLLTPGHYQRTVRHTLQKLKFTYESLILGTESLCSPEALRHERLHQFQQSRSCPDISSGITANPGRMNITVDYHQMNRKTGTRKPLKP